LLFETGVGGWHGKDDETLGVTSTTGKRLTLHEYTQAMLYQSKRLATLGRLAQHWALDMHSRAQEHKFATMKNMPTVQARRRDVNHGNVAPGVRASRMPSTIVDSNQYNRALTDDAMSVVYEYGKQTRPLKPYTPVHSKAQG
jgi:hypothetical protein